MNAGTRVRVIGGPWPERVGCEGQVVDGPDRYPWHGVGRNERVVLLDDDPLLTPRSLGWSCVLNRRHLEVAA